MNTLLFILLVVIIGGLGAAVVTLRRETQRLHGDLAAGEESLAAAREELSALQSLHTETRRSRDEALDELRTLREEHLRTQTTLAGLRASAQAEIAALRQKQAAERETERAEREQLEERFRLQFKNLATEILGEQTRAFKQTNRESMDQLLRPFRENITAFRERVEHIYSHENEQRGELKNELKHLMELNQHISADARNLTDALKGNSKVQGDWGEMLLETILDSSSLSKGIHYETQYNLKDDEGRNLRPDVVLHLPEGKHIIIDSKVSLTAYVNYTSAQSDEERRRFLAAHVASVRQHVIELGRKEYQRLLRSPDFVIMFVPNEPAFLAALQSDPKIWSDAYDRKVIVSSPTNLFALLKLVADLWKYNDQDKNTREIADCGLKLYEQLVAFTASLEGVGAALDKARASYDDAYKRLCTGNRNIIRVGEELREKARLQTKRKHSARTLELAERDTDKRHPSESAVPAAEVPTTGSTTPTAETSAAGTSAVGTSAVGVSETQAPVSDSSAGISETAAAAEATAVSTSTSEAPVPESAPESAATEGSGRLPE